MTIVQVTCRYLGLLALTLLADYPSYPYPAVQQEKSVAMWNTVGSLFTRASGDFLRAWRSMACTDVAYKLIAFAILTPATTWLL